jgi:hypothetical protein
MPLSERFLRALRTWNRTAEDEAVRRDISLVCELYPSDAVPGVDGFDPVNAIDCFTDYAGWEFRGRQYRRLITKWSDIQRSSGPKFNSNSVTFDNSSSTGRYMAKLALERPENSLENCQLVVRLVSRSQSYELNDTYPGFVGKCEKAIEVGDDDFQLSAKQHVGSVDEELPPRRYTADDPEHDSVSPLSEAFRYAPTTFTVQFKEKVARGVWASLIGLKTKSVTRTRQFSTHSDLNAEEAIPIPIGRVQMLGKPIASVDKSFNVAALYSFGDGVSYGIEDYANIRNNTLGLGQPTGIYKRFGYRAKEGEGSRKQQPTGVTESGHDAYPGDGFYSRTAWLALDTNGSTPEQDDPAAEISAVLLGCRVPLPDASGNYLPTRASINAASDHLTGASLNYRNGDELWIEKAGDLITDADGTHRLDLLTKVLSGGGTSTLVLEHTAYATATDTRVRKIGWTDNPVHVSRWLITDPHLCNIAEEFMDDGVNFKESLYDDQFLEDESHADTVMLPGTEISRVGNLYHLYNSGSRLSPEYFRRNFLNDGTVNPNLLEADPTFFDPLDPTTQGTPTIVTTYRRRYTVNVPITDSQKAVDFLNDVIFPAARLYLVQGSNGKIQIRHKRPVDNTLLRGTASPGDTEIPVQSVMAWLDDLSGKVVIGAQLVTSECRTVTGTRYSTVGNSITLTATGGLTASGGTFAGGDGASTPATAQITVTSLSGTKTIAIDGVSISYAPASGDTVNTVGAMLAAAVNANPTLNEYVKATWNPTTPLVVSLMAKVGFLQLEKQLEYDHTEAEEVIRVAMSLSDHANTQADCERANIIDGSFKWPLGSRQSTVNQVILKYRDSSQDFKLTELRIPKRSEIKGTVNSKEISGSAIDNYHQAVRVANGFLSELRDGDFFSSLASDGEALTLSEGSVIAVTAKSGGFVNLIIRIEDLTLKSDLSAAFTGRRYLSSMYSDDAPARSVPLPTVFNLPDVAPGTPTGLTLSEHSITATSSTLHGVFAFAIYKGRQTGRILLKRDGESVFSDAGIVSPDSDNNGTFDLPGLPPGTHEVKIQPENGVLIGTATSAVSITTTTSGTIEVGASVMVGGDQVVGPREAAVPHVTASTGAVVSGSAAATYDAATQTVINDLVAQVNTMKTALDATKTAQNTTLTRMETHGLIAP